MLRKPWSAGTPWTSRIFGQSVEKKAARFLVSRGLTIVQRNFQCQGGEIDLILEDRCGTLVFAEVRFRRTLSYGGAAASVTRTKQRRIKLAAMRFLLRYPRYQHKDCRFDVIAVRQCSQHKKYSYEWLRGAFV